MASGIRSVDKLKIVPAFFAAAPSAAAPTYVSMKGYNDLTVILRWKNGANSAATPCAITMNQAKFVNGNGAKACQLDYQWAANDVPNSVNLVQTAIASNTFNADATNSAQGMAILEVRADRMDLANGFTSLSVGIANAANVTMDALYLMGNIPRYSGGFNSFMNPLVD